MKSEKSFQRYKTTKMEFGGTPGVTALIFMLPIIVYTINLACGKESCSITRLPKFPSFSYFFDMEATCIFFGWLAFQVVLSLLPVGQVIPGQLLNSGKRLMYRCNGSIIYDFFVGHELNPRIGSLDLKIFFELRPGLIGWIMLNFVFVLKAYQDTGTLPPALAMVTAFQTLYIADILYFESHFLTTMDIMHDGFGYMLAFGDLVWVPFLYCLQTRYLLEHPRDLTWYAMCGIALLNFVGYYIFRSSNSEKNEFRKNPHDPKFDNYETIPTASGKKLLVSGWWGMVRKPNYLGDLCMALAWSLPCGLNAIPYFYPVYFLIFLVHRERRDSIECYKKYGSSWDRYCQRVKYKIFPYIY
ncbi:delta(14)-sterol reductase LBR-like isoform X3 [Gigantopelta aegis]|uniref:delta(14)-sterol reductase LBR-like isoform X3 n=1 Tax=Gigantopelta aegis TaxID=1735272 RepID=UPI001B88BD45|nr:delta(14)-sterol reductase LBR-like isoform X3 [Gigantopelta aegis]